MYDITTCANVHGIRCHHSDLITVRHHGDHVITSQRNVAMLSPRALHFLVSEQLEVFADALTSHRRIQHVVHEASLRRHHGVLKSDEHT